MVELKHDSNPSYKVPAMKPESAAVKLSIKEVELLVSVAAKPGQQLSFLNDKPSTRTVNSLVRKGMLRDIMGTFWEITDSGRLRVTAIK